MRPSLLHAALIVAAPGFASSISEAAEPFDTAEIYVEKNATDGDTEIVIEAVGGDDGLCHLRVIAPGGREIFHFDSNDRSTGGLREFLVESPEPPGDAILAAYPEGLYRFRGSTCEGQWFSAADWLHHRLPAAAVITGPSADSEVDGDNGIVIEWSAVPGVAEYILELENESANPEQSLTLNLPADTTRFRSRPAGLLTGRTTRSAWRPWRETVTSCSPRSSSRLRIRRPARDTTRGLAAAASSQVLQKRQITPSEGNAGGSLSFRPRGRAGHPRH